MDIQQIVSKQCDSYKTTTPAEVLIPLPYSIKGYFDDHSHDNSIGLMLLFDPGTKNRFLLLGNVSCDAIYSAIASCEDDLRAKLTNCIITVPHQGNNYQLECNLIKLLSPRSAVISASLEDRQAFSDVYNCLMPKCKVYVTGKSGHLMYTGKSITPLDDWGDKAYPYQE